jgi:Spy/CpxP family protein refolding chaperone
MGMKTSLMPLLFLGAALAALPLETVLADDTAASGQTTPSDSTPGTGQNSHHGFKKALAQLNLTDAQKQQIKQIRASVTDKKERRQQVWQVLTPDQQAKLKELRRERKEGGQSTSERSVPGGT